MSEASYEFAVVCEAQADQLTACGLADRMLLEEIDWLTPEMLGQIRRWRGAESYSDERFVLWRSVRKELTRRKLPSIFGGFGEESGGPDAYIARQALFLLAADPKRRPDAVLLIRDSDGDLSRRQGLEQARDNPRVSRSRSDARPWPFKVVIAFAHPKREAWVLAGFRPSSPDEEEGLRRLRERLSLDPIHMSHALDAREHGAKTDIKRALHELIDKDDWRRQQQCLEETPLDVLVQRGQENGLAAFMAEVRDQLVPIINGPGRPE